MSGTPVAGWSALTSAGIGADRVAERLSGVEFADAARPGASVGVGVAGLYPEPLPAPTGHALVDFDVRSLLGRKGTSSFDRVTGLGVVCCQDALRAAGLELDAAARARVGVVLGTSLGSFKSTADYSRETLVQERPYLVNPVLFPNTVMNCAAGQVAIRFGLRGVNATVAGGALGFLNALRYAQNALDRGYADIMLAGALEEFTPHRAWAAHLTGATGAVAVGEAAGVFVLRGPAAPGWAGDREAARVLAVATGFGPGGGEPAGRALAGCVTRALHRAGVPPAAVQTVLTGEVAEDDDREYGPVVSALGHAPRRILPKRLFGECDAASGAVSLAVYLAEAASGEHGTGPAGVGLITGRGPDGAVGAALVRRGTRAGADRG